MTDLHKAMSSRAAIDVLAERQRQQGEEGWTAEHDDHHADGSMALAAACYAVAGTRVEILVGDFAFYKTIRNLWGGWLQWPWARRWWKPKDRRRNLVRAGALILAEIDRLDRAASRALDPPPQAGEGNRPQGGGGGAANPEAEFPE